MTLTPAYGRDYKSKKEVLADFDANKDFIICEMDNKGSFQNDGRYINKEQLNKGEFIQIRYKKLSSVIGVQVK